MAFVPKKAKSEEQRRGRGGRGMKESREALQQSAPFSIVKQGRVGKFVFEVSAGRGQRVDGERKEKEERRWSES